VTTTKPGESISGLRRDGCRRARMVGKGGLRHSVLRNPSQTHKQCAHNRRLFQLVACSRSSILLGSSWLRMVSKAMSHVRNGDSALSALLPRSCLWLIPTPSPYSVSFWPGAAAVIALLRHRIVYSRQSCNWRIPDATRAIARIF
jgi:hypothetical protein